MVGSGATASETLKNLVLPSVGRLTVADDALITHLTALKDVRSLYPNRLALPSSRYSYIATVRRASGTDTTLLTYLQNTLKAATQQPDFQIVSAPELENGGTATSSKPYFIWYRYDQMVAGRVLALPFSELAAQLHGFQTVVPCHAQAGGLVVFKPLALRIGYDS
jgi:hypothetical protein